MDISIIIPVYNAQDFIIDTLTSVSQQIVDCELECIIIDDCGGDNSIILSEKFIDEYDGSIQFRIIRHNINKGASAARNTGIQNAKGKYLYFLDSDDHLFSNSIYLLWMIVQQHPNIDFVMGNFIIQGITNTILNKEFPEFTDNVLWIRSNMCNLTIPESTCNSLIRKDLLTSNNLYFKEGWIEEDTMMAFKLQRHIKNIAFCFEPTYYYRSNENSVMHTQLDKKKKATIYSLIFNEAYHDMLLGDIELYELAYLEKMAERIYNAVGKDGLKLICTKDNILFSTLFKLNRKINSIRFLPIIKSLRLVIKIIRRLLQNKKIFVYKVYTR